MHASNAGIESESSGSKTTYESVLMAGGVQRDAREPANKHWEDVSMSACMSDSLLACVLVSLNAEEAGEKSDPYC